MNFNSPKGTLWASLVLFVWASPLWAQDPPMFVPPAVAVPAKAQAWSLPDISLVATLLGSGRYVPDTGANPTANLALDEAELIFQGYLHPKVRADLIFSYHDKSFEIEEGYVSVLGIFEGANFTAGRERIDIGRLNKLHPHTWATVSAPLATARFLGELKGTGVGLSYLAPLPFYLNVAISGWRMDEPEPDTFAYNGWSATGKLLSSFALGKRIDLELGASAFLGQGPKSPEGPDQTLVWQADLSLKAFPSSYTRVVFQNEIYALNRQCPQLAGGGYQRLGFYNQLSIKTSKALEWTLRHDRSQGTDDLDETWTTTAVFAATWAFTEATTLRLEYGYGFDSRAHDLALQFVFGLGPHTHPIK